MPNTSAVSRDYIQTAYHLNTNELSDCEQYSTFFRDGSGHKGNSVANCFKSSKFCDGACA